MLKWANEIEVDDIISYDNNELLIKRIRTKGDYVHYIGEDKEGNETSGGFYCGRAVDVKNNWSE